MEKIGMRRPSRESELVETPPQRAEVRCSALPCGLGGRFASLATAGALAD
jgi:hypothetical protein